MLQNMLTVGEQVLILFILIAMGYTCGKTKLINSTVSSGLTNIVMYFVMPCVIINAYQRSYDPTMLKGLLLAFLAAFLCHFVSILLSRLLLHDPDKRRESVYRFAIVFSNAGFMALPLQQAVLGDMGVFYGATYITVYNLLALSYGIYTMSRDRKVLSFRGLMLNPAILSVIVGLIFFFTSFKLPHVIAAPIQYVAALNTPLPMMLIGFYLSNAKLGKVLRDKKSYWTMLLRLVISPLISLGLIMLLGIRGDVMVASLISASAPAAAFTSMFAEKYNCDIDLSVGLVSFTTLLSIITMPVIIGFVQTLG